jgi:hypothetical protein
MVLECESNVLPAKKSKSDESVSRMNINQTKNINNNNMFRYFTQSQLVSYQAELII